MSESKDGWAMDPDIPPHVLWEGTKDELKGIHQFFQTSPRPPLSDERWMTRNWIMLSRDGKQWQEVTWEELRS